MVRLARFTVFGLGIVGVLPPLAFTARPGDLGLVGAVPVSIALTGLLILAPALVGLVAALFGLDGVRESFRLRGDKEHEQAVWRVFAAAAAVAYGFAVEASPAYAELAGPCQIVAAIGLAGAWVFLLLTIVDPMPSALRYYLGLVYDVALLSAFLHIGGIATAAWFPLYLLAIFYAGARFGLAALATASGLGLIGFAAVAATTPFWQGQELLAAGLLAALVALPAYIGFIVREVGALRGQAASAQAARGRFMLLLSQALRAPLDAMIDEEREADAVASSARVLLSQVNSVLDFAAIEAGAFAPEIVAFDLHRVINEALGPRRAGAMARGLKLRVHIAPALPYRLRGWPRQLAQIVDSLVGRAIEVTREGGAVGVVIDAGGGGGASLDLRIAVHDTGPAIAAADASALFDAASGQGAFGLAVAHRLVELMGGRIAVASGAAAGGSLTATLPFAVDAPPADDELDLRHCLVLIATEDREFASELAEPLNAWHADPRWIEGFGATLGFVDRRDTGACSVLVIDGRSELLAALSFAHRASSAPAAPAFVLLVAAAAQIDGLVGVPGDEIDAVLAAPLDVQLLANALHALPLWQGATPHPVMVLSVADDTRVAQERPLPLYDPPRQPAPTPQVTPISDHPRFGAEPPIVDARTIAALRALGDGDAFLGEVIDGFRADAREIMQRIGRAVAGADAGRFVRDLHALRSCAANLGGMRLCELLLSLRELGARDLREHGGVVVQRLGDELARLEAALFDFLPDRGTTRREA